MRDFKEGQLITVAGELAEPVARHPGRHAAASSTGHVVIDVAPFAKAVVILEHTGDGDLLRRASRCGSATAPR